jgi:TolB-like protein/Tfp pilus assembly protein PilF
MVEGGGEDKASVRAPAVFISYASQDAEAAKRICDALRAAGIEVWFDQSELRGGDVWDRQIRQQIHDCRLFMPIVSANAEARVEGYFRREWKLAVDRTHDLSERVAFLVPIVIDSTPEATADVPDAFRHVQWTRLPGGSASPAFVEQIRRVITSAQASALPAGATPPAYSTAQLSTTKSAAHGVARFALWASSGVVALGLAYFAADRLWFSKHRTDVHSVAKPADDSASNAGSPAMTASTFNPPPHSIAVLPFVNMSGDKEQEYFSDGLTEEILNSLARINELRVSARTSSFSFKGKDTDISTIARKLNVGSVLEGSVRRSGHMIRVTAQLNDAITGFNLWSQSYDRNLSDVLKLQTEIANAVTSALKVSLLGDVATKVELGGTHNPAAFDAFLRAKEIDEQNAKDVQVMIDGFTEAIRLDPNYSLAFVGRSDALLRYGVAYASDKAVRDFLSRAMADAQRAVALTPDLPEGHLILAANFAEGSLDFARANEEYERALALGPGNARVLRNYGVFTVLMGHYDAGLAAIHRALVLDPVNKWSRVDLAYSLRFARRYEESTSVFQEIIALQPPPPVEAQLVVAWNYYALGDFETARSWCEREVRPDIHEYCLAAIYEKLGRHAEAEAAFSNFRKRNGDSAAFNYAQIYAQWGNTDKALEWLETALRQRYPGLDRTKTTPLLDPLRKEPRFQAVERELKFPN